MYLKQNIKDFSYNVNLSIEKNLDNNLRENEHKSLYKFFADEKEQYYHTLVKDIEGHVKEEFYLLLFDKGNQIYEVDELDEQLNYIKFSEFDLEINKNLLTICVNFIDYFIRDYFTINFIYDLNDTMVLYELNQLLNQDKANVFFLRLINKDLIAKYYLECIIPNEFKSDLEKKIDIFLDGRPVIFIDDILDEIKSPKEIEIMDYTQYNWVDVKDFAKKIFWNYAFEMPWAEDTWNILLFNKSVKSNHTVQTEYELFEYGDIILWLVAMYDLYFEYKAAADYESIDDEVNIMEFVYYLDNAEKYIGLYLKDEIYEELNEQLLEGNCDQCEFYDIETNNFEFINDYTGTSIAYDVCRKEIENRRTIVEGAIRAYFNGNIILISEFMEGTHWCKNYFDNENKTKQITDKFEKILKCVNEGKIIKYNIGDSEWYYTNEDEVNDDMENELEALKKEIEGYRSDAQTDGVYNWISNGMSL